MCTLYAVIAGKGVQMANQAKPPKRENKKEKHINSSMNQTIYALPASILAAFSRK